MTEGPNFTFWVITQNGFTHNNYVQILKLWYVFVKNLDVDRYGSFSCGASHNMKRSLSVMHSKIVFTLKFYCHGGRCIVWIPAAADLLWSTTTYSCGTRYSEMALITRQSPFDDSHNLIISQTRRVNHFPCIYFIVPASWLLALS